MTTDPTACVVVGAGACGTNFTVGSLTTQGAGATGVLVRAAGPTTGRIGTVQTAGTGANAIDIAAAPAVCVVLGIGGCDVTLTPAPGTPGNVTTTGPNSVGVLVNSPGRITTTLGAISTAGINSPALSIITNPAACATIGAGACTIASTVGPVTTAGANSPGIIIAGANDPVALTCSSVTTLGAASPAVAIGATGAITVRCGALSTTGPASDGLQIVGGAGPIDAIVASVITRGIDSDGVQVSGTGSITLNTGNVTTGADLSTGVLVAGGAGPLAVVCGDVVTSGPNSPGVDVAGTGAINVNCRSVTTAGINGDGINVVGGAGTVTVTSGPIRTVGGNSPGIDVTSTTGAQVITAGGVNVSGLGSDAIRAAASGCANINVNATSAIVSAQGTGILASTLCSVVITTQSGAAVSGALAGINATSGTGTTITLNDAVSSSAGPAIDANGAAAVININAAGSITGRIDLTDNNDTVNNAGRFNVVGTSNFGGGTDVFNNLASGVVSSTAGAGVLANCETFNNAGTITMINGAATNTLSICGNYVGSGAANLGIDVGGGAGGLIADRLIIGGNAGGSTGVNLALLAGSAVIDPDGVLIVDALTATGTPFNLLGQTSFGLINYSLVQTGADTFLVSRPDRAIFDVATLNNFAQELWHQSASANQSCAASRRNDFGVDRTSPISICAQLYGSEDRVGDNNQSSTAFGTALTFSDRLKTKRRGAQVELGFRAGDNFTVGATAGYGHAKADLASGSHIDADGHNYGLFAQFGTAAGLYAGVLAKRDNYDVRFGNGEIIPLVRPDIRSTGIDGEIGWRTPSFGPMLDVNAGLSYVRTRMDDFTTGNIAFDNDRMTSVRGRIGARLGWTGDFAPFVDAKLFHEFRGNSDVRIASGGLIDTLNGRGRGTWGRLEGGLGAGAGGGGLVSVWADLGDVKGWGLRAGFRF